MIDKNRILKSLDSLIERSSRWIEDAEKREDWNDVSYYSGQRKLAEEFKGIVEKW